MVKLLNKKLQSYRGGALRPCQQHISSIQKINKIKLKLFLTSEKTLNSNKNKKKEKLHIKAIYHLQNLLIYGYIFLQNRKYDALKQPSLYLSTVFREQFGTEI